MNHRAPQPPSTTSKTTMWAHQMQCCIPKKSLFYKNTCVKIRGGCVKRHICITFRWKEEPTSTWNSTKTTQTLFRFRDALAPPVQKVLDEGGGLTNRNRSLFSEHLACHVAQYQQGNEELEEQTTAAGLTWLQVREPWKQKKDRWV